MVDAIRSTGARQPIILSGRDFGNDVGDWLANRPPDDQLIAGFHNYSHQPCNTVACWEATVAPVAAQVPVVSGEFGENDCSTSHVDHVHELGGPARDRLPDVGVVGPARHPLLDLRHARRRQGRRPRAERHRVQGPPARARAARHARRPGHPGARRGDRGPRALQANLPGARDRSAAGQAEAQAGLARAAGRAHAHARARAPAPTSAAPRRRALSAGQPVAARVTIVVTADSVSSRKTRVVKLRR